MRRANKLAVNGTKANYEGRFWKTHVLVATIKSEDTEWKPDATATETANRESFRAYLQENAEKWDIDWKPELQKQAWERKHNTYMDEYEIEEDAVTLMNMTVGRLIEKCKYPSINNGIRLMTVTPMECDKSYVEDGRYTKSGAWCMATIEMELDVTINERSMLVPLQMQMKSGQLCKPKMTIADWNAKMEDEMDLNEIPYKGGRLDDSKSEDAEEQPKEEPKKSSRRKSKKNESKEESKTA